MSNWIGLALSCLLGLFLGGGLGGVVVWFYQQIRMGRVDLPPVISLGPLKVDTTGLAGIFTETRPRSSPGDAGPALENAGSATAGCLSLTGAAMVLIGFLLPWFTCNLVIVSGSFSGFSMLVQTALGVILALFGASSSRSFDTAALGGAVIVLLLLATVFVALVPLAGLSIGRTGFRLVQSLRASSSEKKAISRSLMRAAFLGLAPMLCYVATASANLNLSSVPFLGEDIGVTNADTGVWVTLVGFLLALAAGVIVSAAVSWGQVRATPATQGPEGGAYLTYAPGDDTAPGA